VIQNLPKPAFEQTLLALKICNARKARIRLEIKIKIRLEFNQLEERKPNSSLVNFALIGQNPI